MKSLKFKKCVAFPVCQNEKSLFFKWLINWNGEKSELCVGDIEKALVKGETFWTQIERVYGKLFNFMIDVI